MFMSCETQGKRLKTAKKTASAFYFQLSGGSYNRNADQNELVTKGHHIPERVRNLRKGRNKRVENNDEHRRQDNSTLRSGEA